MLSKPPTTTTSCCFKAIDCDPYTIDFSPEEQTLFIVVQVVEGFRPDLIAACLAGA